LARTKDARVAAKHFEALLLQELMKVMRAGVQSEDATGGGGFARDTVFSMHDEALADASAGRLGLVEVLAREFGASPRASQPLSPTLPTRSPTPLPVESPSLRAAGLVDGVRSSAFGRRTDPITGEHKFHAGVDIAAPRGSEIRAAADGRVSFAGSRPGYGLTVEILHSDGVTTRYAHASRLHVRVGDVVEAGEAVADVGSTGRSTGPHLHFEVRRGGHAVDPDPWLAAQSTSSDHRRTGIAGPVRFSEDESP
jgi:murein DD-endopeptidase MepM/ murein hydrolase activator NlpD